MFFFEDLKSIPALLLNTPTRKPAGMSSLSLSFILDSINVGHPIINLPFEDELYRTFLMMRMVYS